MSAPADAATSPNLIVNGDAEAHLCTRDWTAQTPVPGWRVLRGAASVLCYSAFAFTGETPLTPVAPPQGKALFAAPGADTAMEQSVDVAAAREGIDRGDVRFELSGWLGGVGDRPERATLTAVFLDDEGHAVGAPAILAGPDAAAREHATGLVAEKASGAVPPRTRRIVVTLAFVSGMTSFQNAFADNVSLTLTGDVGSLAPRVLQPPTADIPQLDHMFILMMENTNYADVVSLVGAAPKITDNMPFLASLAAQGVLLTDSWGTYHPSDQNYVAMVAGDTFKFGPVYYPDFDLPETHIGDLIDLKGKTWRGYVQHMDKPCDLVSHGWFAPDDEPFAQFKDVISNPTRCQASLLDLTAFTAAVEANALPNFAWLAADGWSDGEGAWEENFDVKFSLVKQDAFLRSALASLLASSAWRDSRSIVVVTWDETDGWGWPDNHVPTIVVGSPGLVLGGATVAHHYDGYGVLRTAELALGLKGLNRFDKYAEPWNAVFAKGVGNPEEGELSVSRAADTRGSLSDTFGQVGVPAAVEQGQPLLLTVSGPFDDADVVDVEPLGVAPSGASFPFRFDASGSVSIPTGALRPGFYSAWLRHGSLPPARAPLPVIVLSVGKVTASAPGVEIVGAALDAATPDGPALQVKEGANFVVHYCGGAGATEANSWIGIFAEGTPIAKMTKTQANEISNWLYAPEVASPSHCGEAGAFPAELAPNRNYRVYLLEDAANGASTQVGSSAAFRVTPALPH
jgi:hypothetical protein